MQTRTLQFCSKLEADLTAAPNAAGLVQILAAAGADVNASAPGHEAPLHWAASSDDLALIDAPLDAGADIEREGASIYGGAADIGEP